MLKITLAAVLILGTMSAAFASEFDGNLQNRYPQATSHMLATKPVALSKHAPSITLDIAGQTFGGGY